MASYILDIVNLKPQISGYQLQVKNNYRLQIACYKLQVTSYGLYKLKITDEMLQLTYYGWQIAGCG